MRALPRWLQGFCHAYNTSPRPSWLLPSRAYLTVMRRNIKYVSSTQRRHLFADGVLALGSPAIRPCAACIRARHPCIISSQSERCEQCVRFNRRCDLAPPWDEVAALLSKKDNLDEQIFEAEAKALRLRRQKRLIQKRLRALGEQEMKNIEELEAEEAAAEAAEAAPASEDPATLESPSGEDRTGFSQFSWDDFDRMSPMPFGSG